MRYRFVSSLSVLRGLWRKRASVAVWWRTDKEGVNHNRVVMVATKFYPAPEKEEAPAKEEAKPKTKKTKK